MDAGILYNFLRESSDDNWIQLKTEEQKEAYKKARKSGMSHPDAINKAKEKPKMDESSESIEAEMKKKYGPDKWLQAMTDVEHNRYRQVKKEETGKDIDEAILGHFVKGKFVVLTEAQLNEEYYAIYIDGKQIATYRDKATAEEHKKDYEAGALRTNPHAIVSVVAKKHVDEAKLREKYLGEALPGEEEERQGDANKDALADKEAEDAMDSEQEDEAKPEEQDNPDPNEVEEEDETEDSKEYLGNTMDQHYYLVRENGELKIQDAAGDVEFTAKELGTTDKKDFIKKACEKLELNVSYETLEQNDWFEQTAAPLPQGTPEDMAAVGPVGSNPHPPEPEIPDGEATVPEPNKPDLKPLSKEADALTTGAEPLEDEATIGEPEVKEEPVKDMVAQSKYKERKPQDKGTAMKGKTPNPGKKMKEAKSEKENQLRDEMFKLTKEADRFSLKDKPIPDSLRKKLDVIHSQLDQLTKKKKESKDVSEFTAHLNKKGEVKEITIEEDFNVHGHHTKVELDNNNMTESLLVKYGLKEAEEFKCSGCGEMKRDLSMSIGNRRYCTDCRKKGHTGEKQDMAKEALTPSGSNNNGAITGAKDTLGEACKGMKKSKMKEDESPMFEDNRTFESAVNELVRDVMEGLGDLNEAGEIKDFRKKVVEEIGMASKWGYDRPDAGMVKEKAFKKIMRRMKKMKEDISTKGTTDVKPGTLSKEDLEHEFAGDDPEEYLEDGEKHHENLPTDQNKMLESKAWEDKRSYKSLIKGMTKDVMEALEGLKETNRGSIMEEIEFAGQYCLEGRADASYIKKAVMKKVSRKLARKAAGEAKPMQEGYVYGNTPQQKAAFQTVVKTAQSIGLKVMGSVMVGKDLVVDLTANGGEILVAPNGYCEMDNMQFNPADAEQMKDILDSRDDMGKWGNESADVKKNFSESVNVEEWEYNGNEGTIDLYGGGDFIDSFNFMEMCKQFMEVNNPDNAAAFVKADITNGMVTFRDAQGTELGTDPMDELVDLWAQQRGNRVQPEGEKAPQTITGQPGKDVPDVEESKVVEALYNKYVGA